MVDKKKVVILTHTPGINYGGIMQAYALNTYIRHCMRYDTYTTHISSYGIGPKNIIKDLIRPLVYIINNKISNLPTKFDRKKGIHNKPFINEYIPQGLLGDADFLVVGSDQVWRQAYVDVDKYMFSFTKDDSISRISYAASFGRDDIDEYSKGMKAKTAKLAKKFKAISVREKSGIDIVKNNWGVDADYHIDPTLLFDSKHYDKLIDEDMPNLVESDGEILSYVLDTSGDKGKIISKISDILNKKVFEVLPPTPKSYREYKKNPDKYNLPPVTQWLKSFRDAEFVVTDSFHGCVFSIIYNKPFIAIGNKARGLSRFTSLLGLFGLESRLVGSPSEATEELINANIDWKKVNALIKKEQQRSKKYLEENLK